MMEVKSNLLNEMKCFALSILEAVLEYCFDIL